MGAELNITDRIPFEASLQMFMAWIEERDISIRN